MIYTSRYSNPELKNGFVTAVQISTSKPRWDAGYAISHQIADLIPYGIFKNYTGEAFKAKYIERLEKTGVDKIHRQLSEIEKAAGGNDIVLLCYEDVRIPDMMCHRRYFAEWWEMKTGEFIPELRDPTLPKEKKAGKPVKTYEQISLFA